MRDAGVECRRIAFERCGSGSLSEQHEGSRSKDVPSFDRRAGGPGKKAWTMLAMMIGAVLVAQALPPGEEAGKIIEAALERAISMIDKT
jgi:hypothetical protein